MTREEIMAIWDSVVRVPRASMSEELTEFAHAIAAREREECAMVCERYKVFAPKSAEGYAEALAVLGALNCIRNAIRARSEEGV